MVKIMKEAIQHKGYALVDIFQPCVVFNKINTFKWYKENTYKLDDDYDPTDKIAAFQKSQEYDDGIPIGVIYKKEKPSFLEGIEYLKDQPSLVKRDLNPERAKPFMEGFF